MLAHLNRKDYYNSVYGGWLGKNIGGTLGGPMEGRKEVLNLEFFPQKGPLPNDDLDLQLVWLHALETHGPELDEKHLSEEWLAHVFFNYDEYGYGLTNARKGMVPPLSGWFDNPFTNCMGSPIRSEIWGMVAPGRPDLAIRYALADAVTDHAGGEGVYGEMFFAAIESAAFVNKDRDQLLQIGLSVIPETCRVYAAVKEVIEAYESGKDWLEAREIVLEKHGRPNFTDAPQNIAFTVLGWLYGTDFGDAILKAVNCGYDTDCTGATLGAILGIILGRDALPQKWIEPVGDEIMVTPTVHGFDAPKTLKELTDRTCRMGMKVLMMQNALAGFSDDTLVINTTIGLEEVARKLWAESVTSYSHTLPGIDVVIDLGDLGPAVFPGIKRTVTATLCNTLTSPWIGSCTIEVEQGWQCSSHLLNLAPGESKTVELSIWPPEELPPYLRMPLVLKRELNQRTWTEYRVPVIFDTGRTYRITDHTGTETLMNFPGTTLTLPQGPCVATTQVLSPREQQVQLMVATEGGFKAILNGTTVLESDANRDFMPAYNRPYRETICTVDLQAGANELTIHVNDTRNVSCTFLTNDQPRHAVLDLVFRT
ncbi:MAG: ADP-ribosylglycohydrolase family protein [Limnochordia bacterium]